MRVRIEMIDPRCVEGARPADDAVDFVSFVEKEIRERALLSCGVWV
jgi:hypothetical protein